MTSEHLLSFDRVWRDEKWREIQASISLFKFLIMKVSLSLNGWTAWTLLKLALCSHSDLARSGVSLKTLRFKPDLPVIPLPWFSDLFSFAGELVIPDNANVYYALNSSMESLLFKLKKKADEKPSWGMFSSLFPCLLWSCVLQVSFRQAELKKDKFLLVKIIGMAGEYFRLCRKWNFRETFYCDNVKLLIKHFFSRVVVRKRVRQCGIS